MSESGKPERFRLFVAIRVPDDVKARLIEAQNRLRRTVPEGAARWTRPEQFHLTLRFLGNVDALRSSPLADALTSACTGFGSLHMRSSGIGFFPRARSPRVIWAGVCDGRNRLEALWSAVQASTSGFTDETVETGFTGHITLARIPSIRPQQAAPLIEAATKMNDLLFGDWTAADVEIIRSQLSPKGATYTTLAVIPL